MDVTWNNILKNILVAVPHRRSDLEMLQLGHCQSIHIDLNAVL